MAVLYGFNSFANLLPEHSKQRRALLCVRLILSKHSNNEEHVSAVKGNMEYVDLILSIAQNNPIFNCQPRGTAGSHTHQKARS